MVESLGQSILLLSGLATAMVSTVPENVALFTSDDVMKTNLCRHKADQIATMRSVLILHARALNLLLA